MALSTDVPVAEGGGPSPSPARHRRRWPWVAVAILLAVALTVAGLIRFGAKPAKQVSLRQAESRLPPAQAPGPLGHRPPPGVYQYSGSGTDRLSLPSESQPEGPSMPGTVALLGGDCWTFRIDYSNHHWQTWDFCRRGAEMVETGGRLWQLWPLGPISLTNSTTITCTPAAVILPSRTAPGLTWTSGCTATSSAVKGQMRATARYRYMGPTTIAVGDRRLEADHISITQSDTGSQTGTETYQMWLQAGSGLPLRLDQDISVRTATPLGTSTYTQHGTLHLISATPHQG